jgi:hypothetical protein
MAGRSAYVGPHLPQAGCAALDLRKGLSRCMEAVAQTTHGSGASICDGTTHAESARKSQTNGTRPSPEVRIALRLPPLRFLSFSDPFVQQPPSGAGVSSGPVETPAYQRSSGASARRGLRCLLARRRRQPVASCRSSRTWRRSRGPCEGPRDKHAESEDLGSFGARRGSNVHVAS